MKGQLFRSDNKWGISYMIKEGSGYSSKNLPIHPDDVPYLELHKQHGGGYFMEHAESEFIIDYNTPMGLIRGQEQYSGVMQQSYGQSARLTPKKESWDDILKAFNYNLGCSHPFEEIPISWLK